MMLRTVCAALLALTAVTACGGKSKPPPPPFEDDLVTPVDPVPEPASSGGAVRVNGPTGRIYVAGHVDARYEFVAPAALGRLRGVALQEGDDPRELDHYGPDGVGIPGQEPVALDGVLVFSDPLGLGVDMTAAPAEARDALASQYAEFIQERFPSASPPRYTKLGPYLAIRFELPRVEMPDRPVRSGRHYLVFDGVATVSVDCLWTKTNAERMSKACDDIAASLRRHTAAR